jgi:hypothetical protein
MNVTFLLKVIKSIKPEVKIIGLILIFLLSIPIVSVFALTHVTTPTEAGQVYNVSSYSGDYYAWGNCTWWVSIRRSQIGEHPSLIIGETQLLGLTMRLKLDTL